VVAKKSSSKTVHIKGVGKVQLQRSRRAKHICLSVRPFKGVRIAVPWNVSYKQAMVVAHEKVDWLNKHLEQAALIEKEANHFNQLAPINRAVARNIIVNRLAELARQYRFTYNKVFIRSQRTRWGSCSGQNNINLNVNLIRLPNELMDYIILHELVHTRIKDHSPRFWKMLGQYVTDPQRVDQQLNKYGPMLLSAANDVR
jgi:predicted metal-dependent hydrolase